VSVQSSAARAGSASWTGFALVLAAAVATVPVFWFGFEGLAQEWAKPAFRFKAVVPFLSLLLFLQVLRSVPSGDEDDRTQWFGVAGMGGAMLLAVFGNLIRIDDFVFLAIVGWIIALVVAGFGLRRALLFWPPLATLFLMLPVPRFILAQIQWVLEVVATGIGMASLRLVGIPAMMDGLLLDFGIYRLPAGEVMDGLQNFLPVLLVFFFLATVIRAPLWSRLLPLLLAAPVMVLLCAVRIVLLGLAADRGGGSAAERALAITGDWAFFGFSVLGLLAFTLGALRLAGHRRPLRDAIDIDLAGPGDQIARALTIRPTAPLVSGAIVTAIVSGLFAMGLSRPAVAIEREPFLRFPPAVLGWSGTRSAIPRDTEAILSADDYVLIDFYHPDEAAPVNFWSAYYYTQERDVGGIHSPEVCLPLDGWNIVSFEPLEIKVGNDPDRTFSLNRAVIRRGETRALVYYWFEGRGRSLSNERLARLLVKVDGLLRGRTDGALVRYVTPLLEGEAEGQADARLRRLLEATIDHLPRFVPE
jgi:exosortase D (VPLPA-CTERM-specific)